MTKNERNALSHVLWAKAEEICGDKVCCDQRGVTEKGRGREDTSCSDLPLLSSHVPFFTLSNNLDSGPVIAECFIAKF